MALHPLVVDAILEQLPSAVLVLNARGHVVRSNVRNGLTTAPLAFDPHRPLAQQASRFRSREAVSGRMLEAHETPAALVMTGQAVPATEILFWHPTERKDVWVRVTGRPVFAPDGSVAGGVLVASDITFERARSAHPALASLLTQARQLPFDALTRRERDIVNLLVHGHTNREIGAILHLSTGTVRNHIGRILAKIGAVDRTHAAALGVAHMLMHGRE